MALHAESVLPKYVGTAHDDPEEKKARSCRCLSVKTFILVMAAVIFTQNLVFAVEPATITTIQKQYGLTSFQIGVWFSCFEVGEIISGLLVSYFASKYHKPRILSFCLVISAVCCCLHALPRFILRNRDSPNIGHNSSHDYYSGDLCKLTSNFTNSCGNSTGDEGGTSTQDATVVMIIYYAASFAWGAAWGPTNPLSLVYIDDNLRDQTKTSLYMGLYYAMNYVGPIAGYGLAALTLNYPVDLGVTSLKPNDTDWVGAWWLGYVISAAIMAALTMPLLLFPKHLDAMGVDSQHPCGSCIPCCVKGDGERTNLLTAAVEDNIATTTADATPEQASGNADDDTISYKEELPSLKRFLPTVWSLIRNPLYVCVVMATAMSSWVDSGYFSYLPKYIESQFYQVSSLADVESGVAWSLVSSATTVAGGWFIGRFKLSIKQCALTILCSFLAGAILLGSAMFFYCPQYPIQDRAVSLYSNCTCNSSEFSPVCLDGTTSYYSPCHAGCQNYTLSNLDGEVHVEYFGCGSDGKLTAVAEVCQAPCNSLFPFLAVVTVAYGLPVFAQMSSISILLRCVKKELRAFSISIMLEAVALIAWVPAPMIYGAVIDSACILWAQPTASLPTCGSRLQSDDDSQGSCYEYDSLAFRLRLHWLTDGALLTACLFALCAAIIARRLHKTHSPLVATEAAPRVSVNTIVETDSYS